MDTAFFQTLTQPWETVQIYRIGNWAHLFDRATGEGRWEWLPGRNFRTLATAVIGKRGDEMEGSAAKRGES